MLQLVRLLIRLEWPVRLLNPFIGKFNPFLPEFRADPYPFYRVLRERHPVYFSPSLRGWVLSRHGDVRDVLQDQRFSVDRTQADLFKRFDVLGALRGDFSTAVTRSLLMVDPPDHTRLRRLVNKAFTPRVVAGLRSRVEDVVADLLDCMAAKGEADLMDDFASPLPVIVIAEMLGVPIEDRVQLKAWSDDLAAILDPLQAEGLESAEESYVALAGYLRAIFADRRRDPRGDLISALVAVEDEGEALSEAELLSLCMLILAAGHETTTNLIGNAIAALEANPAERRRLQEDPTLIKTAVDELLRYDSPVQLTDRVATEDCEIHGRRIRKGQLVALLLGAANRDPEVFEDPDLLDVGRAENPHLSFGHGAHFCLGAQLARLETQIALPALLRRSPRFTTSPERCPRKRSIILRGPTFLPVRLAGDNSPTLDAANALD